MGEPGAMSRWCCLQSGRSHMRQRTGSGQTTADFSPEVTLITVVEMGRSSWLVAGLPPVVERWPLKQMVSGLLRSTQTASAEVLEVTAPTGTTAAGVARKTTWMVRRLRAPPLRAGDPSQRTPMTA